MNPIKPAQPQIGSVVTPSPSGKLLRLPAVIERCGLGRTSIHNGVKNGTFVKPVRLSARLVGWREEEITRWIADRVQVGAVQS